MRLKQSIIRRARHLWEIVLRQIYWLVFVVFFSGLAAVLTWRDELLSEDTARKFRLLNVIPHWDWGWWALLSAAVIVAVMVDGSYRVYKKLMKENGGLRDKLAPKFTISFDDASDCFAEVPFERGNRRKRQGSNVTCPAWWILVRVIPGAQQIIGCQAHLVDLFFKNTATDEYKKVTFQQGAALQMESFAPLDVAPNVTKYVNVFAVDQIDERIRVIWPTELQANEHMFAKVGFYKLIVQVSSQNAGHAVIALELEWRGVFEKPRVRAIS